MAVIGGNLAIGMGGGELTNQHPAWEILQEMLSKMLWEIQWEILQEILLREQLEGGGSSGSVGLGGGLLRSSDIASDDACLKKWLRK